MRADVQVQQAARPSDVLEPFAARARVSDNFVREPIASHGAVNEAEEKDSSIYDFSTYAEGKEAVRLLIQNGFDGTDLWLIGQGQLAPGGDDQIRSQDRHGHFWAGVSRFVSGKTAFTHESARTTGPQTLMMHANSVQAGKAHGVLVEHTNGLIEECLRFR